MKAPAFTLASVKLSFGFAAIFGGVAIFEQWPSLAEWLEPFNRSTAAFASNVIRWSGEKVIWQGTWLDHPDGFGLDVGYGCTALVPILLVMVFILAVGRTEHRRLASILLGSAILMVVNCMRLVLLFYVGVYKPQFFDQAHNLGQGLNIAMTAAVLFLWMYFYKLRPNLGTNDDLWSQKDVAS